MALNTFNFNNLDLTANEITVVSISPRMSPERSGEFKRIRGRDGYLFIDDESFEPIQIDITFILPDNDMYIQNVKAKLVGAGTLVVSTEPDGFYKARVFGPLEFGYWLNQRIVTASFVAQPFLYLTAGQSQVILTNGYVYANGGNVNAKPLFIIVGTGVVTISIGSRSFSMDMGATSQTVWVDGDLLEAYNTSGSKNNDMTGDYPYLAVGNNTITWTGTITSLKMYPYTMRR